MGSPELFLDISGSSCISHLGRLPYQVEYQHHIFKVIQLP